jgi:hypothetical protein
MYFTVKIQCSHMRFGCRHRHRHRHHHRCEPIDVGMHIINNIIENLNHRLSTLEANILSVILVTK